MNGSRPNPAETHFAEQHLGDRLSALVDGELGHEARERVLAHLATCARCKAEADAQRRLKNVFAEAAPPPPSESFLARLQGLPGGGDLGGGMPPAQRGFLAGGSEDGVFGTRRGERFEFGYVPAVAAHAAHPADRGFRIHPVGRPDAERPASRGLRFAFAAAGAVSLAAVALGGVTSVLPGDMGAEARGTGTGSNVTPTRSSGTGTGTGSAGSGTAAPDGQRRRSNGTPLAQGGSLLAQTSVAPTSVSAPLLPGMPATVTGQVEDAVRDLSAPLMASAAALSPLIRPLDRVTPLSPAARAAAPGLLSAPVPDPAPAPSVSPSSPPSSASSRQVP